jgi:hypothetical protein
MSAIMPDDDIGLAFDMHGCPNRCRHCWLGHEVVATPRVLVTRRWSRLERRLSASSAAPVASPTRSGPT